MIESQERGSPCIDYYGVMMMIPVKLVSVMCYAKIIMVDLIKSEMEVDDGRDSNEKPEGRSEQNMNACYPF
jgi:hypothetical protein